jgi:hypothetical protein
VADALCCTFPSSLTAPLLLQVEPAEIELSAMEARSEAPSLVPLPPEPPPPPPRAGPLRRGAAAPRAHRFARRPPPHAPTTLSRHASDRAARRRSLPARARIERPGRSSPTAPPGARCMTCSAPAAAQGLGGGLGTTEERPFLWRRDEELRHSTRPHTPPCHGCRGGALLPPRGELGQSPPDLLLSSPSSPPWWLGTARRVRGPVHTVHSVPRSIWCSSGRTRPLRRLYYPPLRGKER